MVNQILFDGCAPEPLIHYLKALGVFRLVAGQLDPQARGAWQGNAFVFETVKTADELVAFFINEYRPTPIVAPWNNSSGFYPGDKSQRLLLEMIDNISTERFAAYRQTIASAREVVGSRQKAPEKEEKASLLRQSRCSFPDEAIEWLDAAYVSGEEKPSYPPLLGSGGNDGRLDFTTNFIARLLDVLPEGIEVQATQKLKAVDGEKRIKIEKTLVKLIEELNTESARQLRAALFLNHPGKLRNVAVGQFHPGGVGGANATQGVTGDSLVNPWDFILAIEGSLLLASSAVRKFAPGARSMASFPFTTRNSTVGYGTATANEKMRAEIWLPIWESFASYGEVAYLFGEGRVRFNNKERREVQTGFDFARAVAELGVDRGITAFQRYGFLERNGQAYLAAPLGRFEVYERLRSARVHELDRWLEIACRAVGKKETPPRLIRAFTEVEDAIFRLCAHGGPEELSDTLVALGVAEGEIALRPRFREDNNLRPIPALSIEWARDTSQDSSVEFEIAKALAAIQGKGKRGAFRAHLEPVEVKEKTQYLEWTKDSTSVVWKAGTLADNLAVVLQRRSIESHEAGGGAEGLIHPQLQSSQTASLMSIASFLNDSSGDNRIEALLRGLSLINWTSGKSVANDLCAASPVKKPRLPPTLPRAYALLKLLFLPNGNLKYNGENFEIRHEPAIVPLLRARHVAEALVIAKRRLHSTRLIPFTSELYFPDEMGVRLAAALLIPISEASTNALAAAVLRP